nr:uncharacterized protein LOC129272497 [Lytechinus pictus]
MTLRLTLIILSFSRQVSEFYTNCSTNAVTSSASCTITVPRTHPRCLSELEINFSAVSREENVTNILTFERSQAVLSPPSAIRAVAISTDEIKIGWAPPTDSGCFRTNFCVELQYISGLKDNWSKDTDASRCNEENLWRLNGLSPGTLYGIRMRAKIDIHEAKYGPWSENVTQQTLEEAPSGLVDGIISKSERVDSDPYKRNVRLSWKVVLFSQVWIAAVLTGLF